MPESYYLLDFPTATLALQALADFVAADAGRPALLDKLRLVVKPRLLKHHETPAQLFWPIEPRRGGDRQWDAFFDIYKNLTQNPTINSVMAADQTVAAALPLVSGLASLLVHSDVSPGAGRPADPGRVGGRLRLLVVRALGLKESAELFSRLQGLTTQVRAARHEAGGQVYQLYCFIDDPMRGSLADFLPPSYLADGQLLNGFQNDASGRVVRVFVPAGSFPRKEALEAYCRLLLAAPGLFGLAGASTIQEILSAIVPTGRADEPARYLHLYLGQLPFYSDYEISPRREIATIDVAGLADTPQAMQRLSVALEAARPRLGYRLRLARSRYTRSDQDSIERLEHERLAISERIADLQGFAKGRPRLLRFGPQQLPAMADVLRFFPSNRLPDLLYGFHARPDAGAGAHFLLVPHDCKHLFETDPLLYWTRAEGPTIDFWLEPNWARDYLPQNHHMVFVPHGRTLTPPLHSWAVDSMDDYLRQTVASLRPSATARSALPLPATPLYLFDGDEERIDVTVVDRAAFRPLHTSLPWLNDNLRLIETWGGAQKFIQKLSAEAALGSLARQSAAQAAQATRDLDELIEASDAQAAAGLSSLLQTMTEEIGRLAGEGETLINQARALNVELETIKAFHAAMQAEVRQTRQTIDQTTGPEVERLVAYYRNLAADVDAAIAQSQRTRDTLGERIDRMVAGLKATGIELRQRLDALRQEGL